MEAYLRAFVNFEQNDWARLLPMAEFAYNNAKNASSGHTPFELNCGYHPRMSYEEDVDPRSKSKSADELSAELRELMIVCQENLHHAQELQKQAHNKSTKPKSYAPGDKVWLNSKYIKTKRNQLPRKWRIYNVFHVSLLEQDTTRKGRVDENDVAELDAGDDESGEYKVEAIRNSAVLRESQNQVIYQVSTIWFLGKVIQKKKIPGSLHRPFSTLGSSSARSSWQADSDPWGHWHCTINGQANHQASSQVNGQTNGSKTKARSTTKKEN